jgi:hypothetical protein
MKKKGYSMRRTAQNNRHDVIRNMEEKEKRKQTL